MNMDNTDNFTKYSEQSHRYLQNAQKFLEKEDLDKASEFLWGAAAQAVKALAAKRGLILKTHSDLWEFMRELATEIKDSTLYEDFRTANYLHSNFYEIELGPHEILSATEQVKRLITRLFEIAEAIK
ncbi:MAG TPA: HEPN domain-containing protein [Methanosarcinales archaeon]|nr:HEPN domain-containing protein [Methanosarcinales archaeon]